MSLQNSQLLDEQFHRAMILCCREWGISPAEFRCEEEEGNILPEDVEAAVQLAIAESPVNFAAHALNGVMPLVDWLYPETPAQRQAKVQAARRAKWNDQFETLARTLQPANEKEAKILEKLKNANR